jgi:hypothetical protein
MRFIFREGPGGMHIERGVQNMDVLPAASREGSTASREVCMPPGPAQRVTAKSDSEINS